MDDENEICDFIRQNSFAILISWNEHKLNATHIPLLLDLNEGEKGVLYGHVAKANYQMSNISKDVLAIFPGAHKYISPQWYESDQTVPTWSYLAVHVYGVIHILEDRDSKVNILKETVNYFEGKDSSYKMENLKENYFEGLLKGITAFKIEITGIEGKKKISQNHPEDRQKLVIGQLEKNQDTDSEIIVSKMKEQMKEMEEKKSGNK